MSTFTERIPVPVSNDLKKRFASRAKEMNVSTAEYLRRAGEAYEPSDDDILLDGLLDQVGRSVAQAEQAIDDALAFVSSSEARLARISEQAANEQSKAA